MRRIGTMPDRAWIALWHGAITVRAALVLAIVSIVVIAVLPAVAADPTADRRAIHILDRLAFGPSAEDLRHVKEIGIERYIAEQLQPAAIEEPAALGARLAALDSPRLAPPELLARYTPPKIADAAKLSPEAARRMRRQQVRIVIQQASRARIWRALYSRRQLQEVMVDFWFNHFNVFAARRSTGCGSAPMRREAIRPHALGRFRDLLGATAHHPAMLFYLDNAQNSAPGSKGRTAARRASTRTTPAS